MRETSPHAKHVNGADEMVMWMVALPELQITPLPRGPTAAAEPDSRS